MTKSSDIKHMTKTKFINANLQFTIHGHSGLI